MLNFNWNSVDESTFQGSLNKYTNAFKRYQTRYFVLDAPAKNLFYFMPDEVRKKGPRGVIELTDCWISPSNEDDVTFTVQTGGGEAFKLRAIDAKERQRWIDKLRACSGANAANLFVSSLPASKLHPSNPTPIVHSSNEAYAQSTSRQNSTLETRHQTLKELKEVIRCVEVNHREFVETIYTMPDDISLHSLSKNMLLLRSISQSCIRSLQDSLVILTRRRMLENEILTTSIPPSPSPPSSMSTTNTFSKQHSHLSNNSNGGKSNVNIGFPASSSSSPSQNRSPNWSSQSNETVSPGKNVKGKLCLSIEPETLMPDRADGKENLLSLISIEVLISYVNIDLNVECHLPCIVFRLLDYPAVSIPYFDQWQVEDFHNMKKDYPNISWRQLLSDQFYELRSANGTFNFSRGKSCLFKAYFNTLYSHLLNVPLFLLLTDQIHDSQTSKSHFVGSCNLKLNELIETLNQSIIKHGYNIPLVEQQTFHSTLFNLMGTKIGTCGIGVRLCHYGTTILTHFPALNNEPATKTDKKVSVPSKKDISEPSEKSPIDTIVKHIPLVNEKKDIGLQISYSHLPLSSNSKAAQTRWTSTGTRSRGCHRPASECLHTVEDTSSDDPTATFYQPPPLYFNSNSDFLQMMTPTSTKIIEKTKENRLSYLATIPVTNFDATLSIDADGDQSDSNRDHEQRQSKAKVIRNRRSNLPLSPVTEVTNQAKGTTKQHRLEKDFLQNFPLLRALVEEALALQQCQYDKLESSRVEKADARPHSSTQRRQNLAKNGPVRPKTGTISMNTHRNQSFIVAKNVNNTRRLYPSTRKTNQMTVIKSEVRDLVDRLSRPKFNKRLERELISIDPNISNKESSVILKSPFVQPPASTASIKIKRKPPLSYGTTRAHRLMTELSRARRAGATASPQASNPSKSEKFETKESLPITTVRRSSRTPTPSEKQRSNVGPATNFSLLNRVDVETPTIRDKNTSQRLSSDETPDNKGSTLKSTFTTSPDETLKLNQTITKIMFSTPESTTVQGNNDDFDKNDDLGFSITDITDYFTDGADSSTRPPTRQST